MYPYRNPICILAQNLIFIKFPKGIGDTECPRNFNKKEKKILLENYLPIKIIRAEDILPLFKCLFK